jgi:hypothetical protein
MAVERLQWTVDAINARLDKRDREDEERLERVARSFENQIATCSDRIKRIADQQEAWHEAERKRREAQADDERQTAAQRFVAKYGLATGVTVALIGGLVSIANTLLGGG